MYKILFTIGAILSGALFAQNYETIVKDSKGTYAETFKYSVGAAADVLISGDAYTKMVDLTCRNNNSTYEIFIGSDSAGATLISHGFPVKDLETFEIGANSGIVHAIAEAGQTVEVRCWEGKIR